jgi:hypothetical protein
MQIPMAGKAITEESRNFLREVCFDNNIDVHRWLITKPEMKHHLTALTSPDYDK